MDLGSGIFRRDGVSVGVENAIEVGDATGGVASTPSPIQVASPPLPYMLIRYGNHVATA